MQTRKHRLTKIFSGSSLSWMWEKLTFQSSRFISKTHWLENVAATRTALDSGPALISISAHSRHEYSTFNTQVTSVFLNCARPLSLSLLIRSSASPSKSISLLRLLELLLITSVILRSFQDQFLAQLAKIYSRLCMRSCLELHLVLPFRWSKCTMARISSRKK